MKNVQCPNCLITGVKFENGWLSHKCGYKASGKEAAEKYIERLKHFGTYTSDISIDMCEYCEHHAKVSSKDGSMCFACGKEERLKVKLVPCGSCGKEYLYNGLSICPECFERKRREEDF